MSESAASAKRSWFMFGAKPAQCETPVRAAAKRRSTRKRAQWGEDAELPLWRVNGSGTLHLHRAVSGGVIGTFHR